MHTMDRHTRSQQGSSSKDIGHIAYSVDLYDAAASGSTSSCQYHIYIRHQAELRPDAERIPTHGVSQENPLAHAQTCDGHKIPSGVRDQRCMRMS